jgi:hypothetical protein
MELERAIEVLRKAVKHSGNIDQKHIDLTLIPAKDRKEYESALMVSQLAVKDGKLTREELISRLLLV